jgi:hypothetical protein
MYIAPFQCYTGFNRSNSPLRMLMIATERAKTFIRDRVKTTALLILPLAAAAVQAHAGSINPGPTFAFTSGDFAGSDSASSTNSSLNWTIFTNGISLYGSTTFDLLTGGTGSGATCGDICAGMSASGGGFGSFTSDSYPINFDFTLQDSNNDPLHWELDACINDSCHSDSGTTGPADSTQTIESSFNITGVNGILLNSWSASLTVDFGAGSEYSAKDTIELDIPSGSSIDFGAPPVGPPVPEPGTGWMLATAGAALACFRRRLWRR